MNLFGMAFHEDLVGGRLESRCAPLPKLLHPTETSFVVSSFGLAASRTESPRAPMPRPPNASFPCNADPETSSTGEQALTVLIFVYCFWVLLLGGRAWWSGSARETLRSSPQNVFLAVTSAVTLIILLPSIVLEHLSPRVQGEFFYEVHEVGPSPMHFAFICHGSSEQESWMKLYCVFSIFVCCAFFRIPFS